MSFLYFEQYQEVNSVLDRRGVFRSCPLCNSKYLKSTIESEYIGNEHEDEVYAYFCQFCGYWELLAFEWGQQDYKEDEKGFLFDNS